jgi:hypothetical protein
MVLNTVTITWDLVDLLQNGIGKSKLTITPAIELSCPSLDIMIPSLARSVTFTGGSGSLAGIVATDNSALSPAVFEYIITITDAIDFRFTTIQPFATPIAYANGATQDLSTLLAAVL